MTHDWPENTPDFRGRCGEPARPPKPRIVSGAVLQHLNPDYSRMVDARWLATAFRAARVSKRVMHRMRRLKLSTRHTRSLTVAALMGARTLPRIFMNNPG